MTLKVMAAFSSLCVVWKIRVGLEISLEHINGFLYVFSNKVANIGSAESHDLSLEYEYHVVVALNYWLP